MLYNVLMNTELAIEKFYQAPEGLYLQEYIGLTSNAGTSNLVVASETRPLHDSPAPDAVDVDEVLHEVSYNLRAIESGGSTFEIATANTDVASDDVMLHISTYSSAISTNPGNAYEFAAQAVRYPNVKHLYVASFGNGGTSPLLPRDAHYAKKTGRIMHGGPDDAKPLQSIQNLHDALDNEGLAITRIMGTDSAGGHYARALAITMEPNQLSHAFFSETSGFKNLGIPRIAYAMMIKEGLLNAKKNRQLSPDSEMVNAEKIDRAKAILKKYEDTDQRQALQKVSTSARESLASMWTSAQTLRRGPWFSKDPLVLDTNVLVAQHPSAKITFGLAENDPLYKSPNVAHAAAVRFLGALTTVDMPVRVVMIPGMSHAYNTYFPSLYHAVKRQALSL